MSTTATTCMICEAACGILVETEGRQIKRIVGDPDDPMSRGYVCPKVIAMRDLHEDENRLRRPLVRDGATFRETSFEEALDVAARGLAEVRKRHGKHALAVYQGNPSVHNLDLMTVGQAVLRSFGTKNLYSATSTDQAPQMMAALELFGHPALMPVPDLDRTELFVIFGANPLVSNGSLMTAPDMKGRLAALQARGGRIIVVDPRRTETAKIADQHLFVRPGSDAVLLATLLGLVLKSGPRYLRTGLSFRGEAELERALGSFSPELCERATGVSAAVVQELAAELLRTDRTAIYGRVGICHQRYGSLSAALIWALSAATGNLDRPGGSMVPTPGVDILALTRGMGFVGYDRYRSRVEGHPEAFGEFPIATLASEIETPGKDQVRALLVSAGNPALSAPNGPRLERALAGLDMMVSLDGYLNETSRHAHVILPPVSPLERSHYDLALGAFSVRNHAKFSRPAVPREAGALGDSDILIELGLRMRLSSGLLSPLLPALSKRLRRWGSSGLLDVLLRTGPHRLSVKELEKHPHGLDLGPLLPRLGKLLRTRGRRVQLDSPRILGELSKLSAELRKQDPTEQLASSGDLTLIGRRQLRSHNSWLHNSRALIKGPARCALWMNPADAAARSLEEGARVMVRSRVGCVSTDLSLTEDLMPGVVSLPHGFGHHRKGTQLDVAGERPGVSSNDLTDDQLLDHLTGNAAFSELRVQVSREAVSRP